MSGSMTAAEILDREFFEIRAKILEIAASFDRLDRAEGSVSSDPRITKLRDALAVASDVTPERAEQIQLIFSRTYEDDWQEKFQLEPRR